MESIIDMLCEKDEKVAGNFDRLADKAQAPFTISHLSETQLALLVDDYLQREGRVSGVAHAGRAHARRAEPYHSHPHEEAISLTLWRQRTAREELHPR